MTDDSYTRGKDNITYREADSLCGTPETNTTLFANYAQILIFFKELVENEKIRMQLKLLKTLEIGQSS